MTQLIIVKNDSDGMYVDWRITNEDEFINFCERHSLNLSFDYSQFLDLNGDYTGEMNRLLNQSSDNTHYLALVA